MHYLDTSILTAYYCPEANSAAVQRLMSVLAGPTISPLVEVEFHCSLARKVRAGGVALDAARRILLEFARHVAVQEFRLVSIQEKEYRQAVAWLTQFSTPLRVLDVLHMSVAHNNALTLVTADRRLAEAARFFNMKCRFVPPAT